MSEEFTDLFGDIATWRDNVTMADTEDLNGEGRAIY